MRNDPNTPPPDPNIRTPEERYGGQGHAGEDPFAGKRAGKKNKPPDPEIEVPNATVEDLVEQPDSGAERTEETPPGR